MKSLKNKILINKLNNKSELLFRGESNYPNKHGAIFFTPDRHYAETGNFGNKERIIISAYLTITNPIIVNSITDTAFEVLNKNIKKWKKQGYDGLIGKIGEHIFEYAVFSKEQIILDNE